MLRGNKKKVGKCSHLFLERVARQLSPSKATNMLPPAAPSPNGQPTRHASSQSNLITMLVRGHPPGTAI